MTSNTNNSKTECSQQLNSHQYGNPTECIIYWDYDANPITNGQQLRNIINTLKVHVSNKIGRKPIQFRIYTCSTQVSNKLQDDFDINGIQHIITSPTIIDSINKRILIDILWKLYELSKHKQSNCACIGLISNNNTHAYLLSQIHKQPPISHIFLISLNSKSQINQQLAENVDFIIFLNPRPTRNTNNCNKKRTHREYNNQIQAPLSKKKKRHKNNNIMITCVDMATKQNVQIKVPPDVKFKTMKKILKTVVKQKHKFALWKPISLYFKGQKLVANKKLTDYSIVENDIIQFQGSTMRLLKFREFRTNNIVAMNVNISDNFASVCQRLLKIIFKEKYNVAQLSRFRLIYGSKTVPTIQHMDDYGICDGDTLRWYFHGLGCHLVSVNVKILGKYLYYSKSYCFNPSKTISDIRTEIRWIDTNKFTNKILENMSVWWKGGQLKGNKQLMSYGIESDAVIVFCIDECVMRKAKYMSVTDAIRKDK
eukprot:507526_1